MPWIRVGLGLVVSALFVVLLLVRVDLGEVRDAFAGAAPGWFVPALLVLAAGLWVRAQRWALILRPAVRLGPAEATSLMLIGQAANNILPLRAGEVVRAMLLRRRRGVSGMTALGTIAVERVFDGLVLALFLTATLALAGGTPVLRGLALVGGVGFAVIALVTAVLAARPALGRRGVDGLLRLAPGRARQPVEAWSERFLAGVTMLRGLRAWALVFAATALSWALEAAAYGLVGEAFGLGLSPALYLGVFAAANLAIAAPSTAGGVGPYEFFAREVAVAFGVGAATATAYAIALHAFVLLPVALAGLLLLWRQDLGLRTLMRGADDLERAAVEGAR